MPSNLNSQLMSKILQKTFLLSFLALICCNLVFSQSIESYSALRSKGIVPPDFNLSSYDKYKDSKQNLDKSSTKFERKAKDRFVLMSSYYNDFLLRSGRIVFGDTISEYINKVADVILVNHPDLRNKIRFYVFRSPIVNAYSIENGVILISTGLLSKLENEAQLAFILGHELIHYTKKHAISQYVESEKLRKGKREYKHLGFDEKILLRFSYSKEDELIADKESVLEFLVGSPYDYSDIDKTFDILNYHHLPYKDIPFDVDFIKPKYHVFAEDAWLKEVEYPKAAEEHSDTRSTHPNVKLRQHIIKDIVSKNNIIDGAKKFVVSENEFYYVRDIARFENLNCYIINNQLAQAYYNVFLMSRDYPDNKYIDKAHAYVLYSIATQKLNSNISDAINNQKDFSGYWQQLFYFFRNIDKRQFNCIAVNKVFQIHRKYPEDEYLKSLAVDLIDKLVNDSKFSISDFAFEFVQAESTDTLKSEGLSRRRTSRVETNRNTLIEVVSDPYFIDMFNTSFNEFLAKSQESSRNQTQKGKKKSKKESVALGVKNLLVFDANCNVLHTGKADQYQFIESEENEYKMIDLMSKVAEKIDLNLIFIDPRLIKSSDIQLYNDSEIIKDWINAKFSTSSKDAKYISWMSDDIQDLQDRHNTKYLFYSNLVYEKEDRYGLKPSILFLSIVLPPAFPFILYYALKNDYSYSFLTAIIDVETGDIVRSNVYSSNERSNQSFYKSILYKELSLVKKSKKN